MCKYLRKNHDAAHVGIIYNLHHGHSHLDRLPQAIEAMKPYLLCFNLNGMDIAGDTKGRKILPLGVGTEDVKVLRQVRASGYSGPVGILNHTNEDAEGRLLDNLDGLKWLLPQLDDAKPGERPKYRTWKEAGTPQPPAKSGQGAAGTRPESVDSLSAEFGKSLKGGWVIEGNKAYNELPLTIECRAKLDGKDRYNILVASETKKSATHWELFTMPKSGALTLYMRGRGGNLGTGIDVCDGKWHDFLVSIDDKSVIIWIDGKQVFEKAATPLKGKPQPGALAFGRLVEGALGCDGILDDVRITRGVMKPRKGNAPRQRMDNTLGLWSFDDLDSHLPPPAPKAAEFTPDLPPLNKEDNQHWQEFVNRERVFDFYSKQALQFMKQKPLPELLPQFPGLDGGKQGHWGNQNDKETWRDGRWAASDLGSLYCGVFKGGGISVPKGICVRFDDRSDVFDPVEMAWRAEWSGGFIKLNENRHGFMSGAPMDGKLISKEPKKLSGTYRGLFRRGKEVTIITSETELPAAAASQWPQWIETKGELGTQSPFATDRLTIPFDNPHGTIFFITAHDFFSDGTAAVATMTGEVWLVKGIDEKLEKLRWKRFATGLHQPLGVKIIEGKLYVLGRDQITCLRDLNGDDEADFYECVTNTMQTSPGGHDFIVGLETDKEGRWYFASANQGVCRIKVGRAGVPASLQVLATGFRNPNGLGLSADGRFVTTSVQEGDWTPATSICQIDLDQNLGAHFGAGGPKDGKPPEPVLMYLPRGEDNSASSQVFITSDTWTTLKGDNNLIHLSSGGGGAWLVMRQQVKGVWQGAAVKISGNFDSGPQCARFHPMDGHLYVNGMQGWGSYTPRDGCFQRVRFTGGDKPVPVAFEARDNGVIIRFNQAVKDADTATCFAQGWNYKYGPQYGSPEYSVKYADTPGHDPLEVRSVQKLDGGKALFLEIPQIVPANQIHVRLSTGHDVFVTAHALAEPFTDFPGYTKIAKTNHAAQI
ncbi:MAG: LamG-like jellyroll fold domain-containing protein, partial [Prosthecobacter sp.]